MSANLTFETGTTFDSVLAKTKYLFYVDSITAENAGARPLSFTEYQDQIMDTTFKVGGGGWWAAFVWWGPYCENRSATLSLTMVFLQMDNTETMGRPEVLRKAKKVTKANAAPALAAQLQTKEAWGWKKEEARK